MTDEFNPYKPGSGLKDDFDGVIVDGTFTTDPQTGTTSIILMVNADDGDEWPARYSTGPGWESYDGGETVRHPGGAKQLFSANSAYSDFMQHAWDAGAKDDMLVRARGGQGPANASNWNGLKFHWEVLERPIRRPQDNEDGSRVWVNDVTNRTLPTKYLGLVGQQGTLGVEAPPVPGVASPSQVASQSGSDPLSVLDAVTAAKVKAAARDAASYEAFIDAMLGLTTAVGTPIMEYVEIGTAVADSGWYAALHKGG